MKKQILFLLLVSAILSVKAQVSKYYPFPDSNAYWADENVNNNGSFNVYTDYGVIVKGDTMFGGKTYQKLYKVGGYSSTNGSSNYSVYYGAFREDTAMRRVYMWQKGIDSLLYDFNLKVNDSIGTPSQPGNGGKYGTDYVYSIDSILVFGDYRKRINIANNQAKGNIICQVIEGIGGNHEPFGTMLTQVPFEGGSGLLCFRQDPDTVQFTYSYFGYDGCREYLPLSANTISTYMQQFTVYPNPANNEVAITYLLQQRQNKAILQLYNALGQLVASNTITNTMGQVNENIAGLSNGIYYYTLSVNGVIAATSKLVVIH
jgi:hypothetical protein